MIDVGKQVRLHLLEDATVFDLVGRRVIYGTSLPKTEKGEPPPLPAVLCSTRGGGQHYSHKVLEPSVQIKCYAADETDAQALYRAVYDALDDQSSQYIKRAWLETLGQTLRDPESGWPYVLTFFQVRINNP